MGRRNTPSASANQNMPCLADRASGSAVAQAVTPAVEATLLRIFELIQIQNTAFQQAQQQTNETLAMAMSMPPDELGDYDALKRQMYAHMGVSK